MGKDSAALLKHLVILAKVVAILIVSLCIFIHLLLLPSCCHYETKKPLLCCIVFAFTVDYCLDYGYGIERLFCVDNIG